jgi:LPXTG-site transpeptidase (sortase) family protein
MGNHLKRLGGGVLLVAGAAMLAAALAPIVGGAVAQRQAQARWAALGRGDGSVVQGVARNGPGPFQPLDGLDFKLSVPRLGYSAVVREGVGLDVLAMGPGHYPQSVWPGQRGDVGLAGHNVYWLRFDQLAAGDAIVLETRYGAFRYRVTGASIVSPAEGWVLQGAADRQLTLTTCWPLWAGEFATRRLAIFARQESPGAPP